MRSWPFEIALRICRADCQHAQHLHIIGPFGTALLLDPLIVIVRRRGGIQQDQLRSALSGRVSFSMARSPPLVGSCPEGWAHDLLLLHVSVADILLLAKTQA